MLRTNANRYYLQILKTFVICCVFICFQGLAKAQLTSAALKYQTSTDTIAWKTGYVETLPIRTMPFAAPAGISLVDLSQQQNLQATIGKAKERRALMKHLQTLSFNSDAEANQSNRRLFFNLGNAFARLRLYSLAMKCFFKTLQYNAAYLSENQPQTLTQIDSVKTDAGSLSADTTLLDNQYLGFNAKDDSLLDTHDDDISLENKEPRSPQITYERIVQTFRDNKKSVAYAMLIHVKQPVPGKRKVYRYSNSGHTFITLIKYNSDSTYTSVSFGFYPNKNHPLAGTPLFPSSPSVFRDDAQHRYDEVAGKFISKRRFEKILALTKKYDGVKYHLNTNNCTDYSLNAALMADITIQGTTGSWPLGHGNNPGITGQSILQGNIFNGGATAPTSLFVYNDAAPKPANK